MATPPTCVCSASANNDNDSPLSTTANVISILTFAYVLFVGLWYEFRAMRQTPREINRLETDMLIFQRRTKTVADALMRDHGSSLQAREDRDLLVGIVEEAQTLLLKVRECQRSIEADIVSTSTVWLRFAGAFGLKAWAKGYVKKTKESTSSYAFMSIWYGSRKKEDWKGQLQELQRRLESFVDSREAPPAFFRVQTLRAPGITTE